MCIYGFDSFVLFYDFFSVFLNCANLMANKGDHVFALYRRGIVHLHARPPSFVLIFPLGFSEVLLQQLHM